MKRYTIPVIIVLAVLAAAWATETQPENRGPRRGVSREEQLKAIATIEEQVAKLKAGLEADVGQGQKKLSEEEKTAMKEKITKLRQERQKTVEVIEEQVAKLRGERHLGEQHEELIGELKAIHVLAVKEKAAETAARIEKLIAARQKDFEGRLRKLGLGQRPADANN